MSSSRKSVSRKPFGLSCSRATDPVKSPMRGRMPLSKFVVVPLKELKTKKEDKINVFRG